MGHLNDSVPISNFNHSTYDSFYAMKNTHSAKSLCQKYRKTPALSTPPSTESWYRGCDGVSGRICPCQVDNRTLSLMDNQPRKLKPNHQDGDED